jgi:hypothetical protein
VKYTGSHRTGRHTEKRGMSLIPRPALRACCVLVGVLLATCAHAQFSVSFLPGSSFFPSLRADGLEHQLSLSKITDDREWIGVVGGSVPVLRYADSLTGVQVGTAASVFSRILKTPGHISVLTLDYRIDIPVEVRTTMGSFQIGYGHVSSHFADDGVDLLAPSRRNVVKDYLRAGYARAERSLGGTVYGIIQWNYHSLPSSDKHWMVQVGMNSADIPLSGALSAYVAGDVKIREDVSWGSTRSIQLGVSLAGGASRVLRFAYTWRGGFDERGQFFDSRANLNMLSIGLAW